METANDRHRCGLCSPLVEEILRPTFKDIYDMSDTAPIDLGTLQDIVAKSARCPFFSFILLMHDQVRPSYALISTSGTPTCDARVCQVDQIRAVVEKIVPSYYPGTTWRNRSYYLDFVDTRNQAISTRLPTQRRATFRLLVDDVPFIGYDKKVGDRELARLFEPGSAFDPTFWRTAFDACINEHGHACERHGSVDNHGSILPMSTFEALPQSMRLVDVVDQMLVPVSTQCRYAALSYVWGACNTLRLTKQNFRAWTAKNGLRHLQKPKTIFDAMVVTEAVGLRYLWIDSLCIIQDDEDDKADQIVAMDRVYSHASLTLIDARSSHANGGLWKSGSRQQIVTEAGGLRWVAAAPTPFDAMTGPWRTRAWTYQEGACSARILLFGEYQAYFSCELSTWAEDYVNKISGDNHIELEYKKNFVELSSFNKRPVMTVPPYWSQLIHNYTSRQLTYEHDILAACTGVIGGYLSTYRDAPLCGLPVLSLLEYGLLWRPTTLLRQRATRSPKSASWPSWSWAGWQGIMTYHEDGRADNLDWRRNATKRRTIQSWQLEYGELSIRSSEIAVLAQDFSSEEARSMTSKLAKIETGLLRFQTLCASFTIDTECWGQYTGTQWWQTETDFHTGYYKVFADGMWIGNVHLEHERRKRLPDKQSFIVLAGSGGMLPIPLRALADLSPKMDEESLQRVCDLKIMSSEQDEFYHVMMVSRQDATTSGTVIRTGVGQIHKASFDGAQCNMEHVSLA